MNPRLRNTAIVALLTIIIAPIVMTVMGASPALVVLSIIAVVGFYTVVFVSVIGSLENEVHPQSASDSNAVMAWQNRLGVDLKVLEGTDVHPQAASDSEAVAEMQELAEEDPAPPESNETSS
jgi:hypothetical protein